MIARSWHGRLDHGMAQGGYNAARDPRAFIGRRRRVVTATPPLSVAALERAIAQAAEVAGHLWERGWAERNAGNFSIDVTGDLPSWMPAADSYPAGSAPVPYPELAGRALWVSATGSRMRDLARAPQESCGLIRIASDGATFGVAWGPPSFQPTSELATHLAVHAALRRNGASARAVLHSHPTELIALTHLPALTQERLNRLLWSMTPETVVFAPDGVALIPYLPPGSAEVGAATAHAVQRHAIALWEKHGAIVVGDDLLAAFDLLDTINKSAALYLACRTAGFQPRGLTEQQIAALRKGRHEAKGTRPE
jgi:rhamnulose-1-phosphate aldolase